MTNNHARVKSSTRGKRDFRVVVATDGSTSARRAVAATLQFPWPDGTRVRVVAARQTGAEFRRSVLLAALDRTADVAAAAARRALTRRWPKVEVAIADSSPLEGVLGEAQRFGADVIVVGWRGHGPIRRLLMGSVSRGVIRGAQCAVLMVRRRPRDLNRVVIAVDGSATARRAVDLVAAFEHPPGGRVTLFSAVEQLTLPRHALAPSAIRASVGRELRHQNLERVVAARKTLDRAARSLARRGWRVRLAITTGAPLNDLLATVIDDRAGLVVVGARGATGLDRLLLGSVAEGVLARSPVPVLVVR